MTRLYVSGPVTGHKDGNRDFFVMAKETLEKAGFTVTIPHDIVPMGEGHEAAMIRCLHDLTRFSTDADGRPVPFYDGVAVIGDWKDSKGAITEWYASGMCGIPSGSVLDWVDAAIEVGRIAEAPPMAEPIVKDWREGDIDDLHSRNSGER